MPALPELLDEPSQPSSRVHVLNGIDRLLRIPDGLADAIALCERIGRSGA